MIKLSISIMWQTWKARNSKSFNGEIVDPKDIVNKSLFDFLEHKKQFYPSISPKSYTCL